MSFASILQQDGAAHVWLLDVSFDDFVSVAYRWSTESCSIVVGSQTFDYEARIPAKGLGKISRGFGQDGSPQAGVVTVSLDNTDFAADWLVDRSTVASQVFRARFKLTLCVYPGFSTPANGATQVMGIFKCLGFPAQDRERISFQLADDSMGLFNDPLVSPTIREWRNDPGSLPQVCPIAQAFSPAPSCDWDQPMPLMFGAGRFNVFPAACDVGDESGGNPLNITGLRAIPVCATINSDPVTPNDIKYLWGVYAPDVMLGVEKWPAGAGSTVGIPKTFTVPSDISGTERQALNLNGGETFTIWEPKKTQLITKDGAQWTLLWVAFNVARYSQWFQMTRRVTVGGTQSEDVAIPGTAATGTAIGSAPLAYLVPTGPPDAWGMFTFGRMMGAFGYFQVSGWPLSAVTAKTTEDQSGVNVVRDLVSYYSHGGAAYIDTARFAKAQAMSPTSVAGVMQPMRPDTSRFKYSNVLPASNALSMGQLRQTIGDICQSSDLDYAMTWGGQVAVFSSYFNFADITASRLSIDETRCNNVTRRTPSKGERWSPYNRLYQTSPDGERHGPFDNPDVNVNWGVPLEKTLMGVWQRPFVATDPLYSQLVWQSTLRRVESMVRPVVGFSTDREGLQLDLGDLFNFVWTRGGSAGPYQTATVHRVERITLDPELLTIDFEAVWVDDIQSVHPYLLDDETFVVRVTPVGGRTVSVNDGNSLVTASGGSWLADGVQAGDVLRLKDSSQAVGVLSRNRDLRISTVTSSQLQVDDSDGTAWNFGAPGGATVSEWEIRRGEETYPTSSTDPAHYPNDGAMYGKGCGSADAYPDATAANVLL